MYRETRREMVGSPSSKHSMNQHQLKLSADASRRFYRGAERWVHPDEPHGAGLLALTGEEELCRLVQSGIFGSGQGAELAVAVHTIGSLLNRYRPIQEGRLQ